MLYAGPTLNSFQSFGVPLPVPAGAIVAWTGTIADIPADWALCDGQNGTPNLSGRFIRSTGDSHALGDMGGGGVSGSTSTDGSHTGSYNAAGNRNSGGDQYGRYADGAHSHGLAGTVDEPLHYTLAYIRAATASNLPPGAAVFADTVKTLPLTGTYVPLEGKLAKAVTDDTRQAGGVQQRTYEITTAVAGNHDHGSGGWNGGGSNTSYSSRNRGSHDHGVIDTGSFEGLPSHLVLKPLIVLDSTGAYEHTVLAYDGDLAALPEGWTQYLPIKDRFPVGSGAGLVVGQSGGTDGIDVGGVIPNLTINHDHYQCCSGVQTAFSAPHRSYAWVHGHTFDATVDVAPAFHCLHFIVREKL